MNKNNTEQLLQKIESLQKKLKTVEAEKNTLQEMHKIYREAIENAQGVPYMFNLQTNTYDFFGDGCFDLLGISKEEITVELFKSLVKEIQIIDYPKTISVKEYSKLFQQGKLQGYNTDYRILTPQGKEFGEDVQSTGHPDETVIYYQLDKFNELMYLVGIDNEMK